MSAHIMDPSRAIVVGDDPLLLSSAGGAGHFVVEDPAAGRE
jgi:hypothetical protein